MFKFEKCFVVRPLAEQADAGSIFCPLGGCWQIQLVVGKRDPRMSAQMCRYVARTIAMLILAFFEVLELDFPELLGVASCKVGGIYPTFRAHGKEGLLPVSGE